MSALLILVGSFAGYILMYHLYGRYIGRRIFGLSHTATPPSVALEDGVDYVPTQKEIIFGHHFTSIAGTGPIVGPAIAIIWGWIPALVWVFAGSIVMGAVHDFGALVISMRNQGKSISDYTAKYINSRTRLLFFLVVFLELWIVIAVFGLVIAVIFAMYPQSVAAVWLQVPIAMTMGYLVYKKGKNVTILSICAIALMYAFILAGTYLPVNMPAIAGLPPTGVWTVLLLAYAFVASVLPVTALLQPRDYINSHQLLVAMVLLILGVLVASAGGRLEMVAPALQAHPNEAPAMIPFLFITIACGAISGFHCLVSSGTSAKQVKSEGDSLFVGFGSMLMEGALAVLVILAVAAGIGMGYTSPAGQHLTGVAAWTAHYASWTAAAGLGTKVSTFVDGAANMIMALGIPKQFTLAIMAVFVASFAGTTLDTATRIQRYVLSEVFSTLKLNFLTGKYTATALAVGSAMVLAFATGASGKGALKLWPLFGAVNQTLAALALIVISVYLKSRGGYKWLVSGIPAGFMAVMTLWASFVNQRLFAQSHNLVLQAVNVLIILITCWIVVEGLVRFLKTSGKVPEKRSSAAFRRSLEPEEG
jgi:carbon starvation protein